MAGASERPVIARNIHKPVARVGGVVIEGWTSDKKSDYVKPRAFEPILARRYETLDNTQESSGAYALCSSCHDPHGSRSEKIPFWKKETFSQVCNVCHTY